MTSQDTEKLRSLDRLALGATIAAFATCILTVERNFSIAAICLLSWTMVIIYWIARRTARKSGDVADSAWSNRRLFWAAVIMFVIGIGPMVSNILASEIASRLGCYIAEFSIYTRSGTPLDASDDWPGCPLGGSDIGSLLVFFNSLGLAIFLTWPFLLISLFLLTRLTLRRFARNRV